MGRYWDCRCKCPYVVPGGLNEDVTGFDLLHHWPSHVYPPPFTIETETFGGAVINSYTMTETSHYHEPANFTYLAARFGIDITAPAGQWNAWLILWIPNSSVPIGEVTDINDPDGIVRLSHIQSSMYWRLKRMNREIRTGPRPVSGLVMEYDGQRYYHPHAYITLEGDRAVYAPDDVDNPLLPLRCWRPVGCENRGKLINLSTLDYDDPAISFGCNPDPSEIDRVGFVLGLSTVGDTSDLHREASGHITASMDISHTKAAAYYVTDCSCWWEPPIPTLTATFETAPVEIVGDTLTLVRQSDGTFTASGIFGVDSLPYTLTYTPCTSLVLEFPNCGLTMTFLHQAFDADNFNGYATATDQWQPIDVRYTNRACYDGDINEVPDCGLTTNSTLPVGSPPFQDIWDCFLFTIRLEQ